MIYFLVGACAVHYLYKNIISHIKVKFIAPLLPKEDVKKQLLEYVEDDYVASRMDQLTRNILVYKITYTNEWYLAYLEM